MKSQSSISVWTTNTPSLNATTHRFPSVVNGPVLCVSVCVREIQRPYHTSWWINTLVSKTINWCCAFDISFLIPFLCGFQWTSTVFFVGFCFICFLWHRLSSWEPSRLDERKNKTKNELYVSFRMTDREREHKDIALDCFRCESEWEWREGRRTLCFNYEVHSTQYESMRTIQMKALKRPTLNLRSVERSITEHFLHDDYKH